MLWQTFFACDKVDFSEVQNVNGGSTHQETWAPVQVFISEVTDNRRKLIVLRTFLVGLTGMALLGWLMVVHNHGGPPVIFRVVEEGWVLSCDEVRRPVNILSAKILIAVYSDHSLCLCAWRTPSICR